MSDSSPDLRPASETGRPNEPTVIVGLGASAGGINALLQFFSHVGPNSRAAFVVILHLSPDHDSRLAEVLQNATPMPVVRAVHHVHVEAGHVYVISPNTSLTMADGMLVLSEITRPEHRRSPIDVFFRTLAEAHSAHAVAVVLSGTGADGSSGVKRVKEYGGLVIAQDPREAEHPEMPLSAIGTGLVDFVMSVQEMPARIERYQAPLARGVAADADGFGSAADEPDALREILAVLRARTSHDFSNYKVATVMRRLHRRMSVRGVSTLAEYAALLRQGSDEAVALMRELLISVTNFFRDTDAFAMLEQRIIPHLFLNKGGGDQVRVWVPGCATGEEAYSLAMLLAERADALPSDRPSIQVFASDLDSHAVAAAREGFYTEPELVDVSEERLRRFFQKELTGYRVRRELREMVLFAHHNVIKDPPFSHLDLISCRNLLIYLNRGIQNRLLETFHFALRPGGWLFLGGSEFPDGRDDLFLTEDKHTRIYQSRTVVSRMPLPVPETIVTTRATHPPAARPPERISPADLHQRLLEQMAPPSIVVSEDYHIVHMSERAGDYLHITGGELSRDLLALVRPELRADLRTALHRATRERATVAVTNVRLADGPRLRHITVTVRPVWRDSDPARGYLLVLLDEGTDDSSTPLESVTLTSPTSAADMDDELASLKSQLHATVEHYEVQAQEWRATNEELQAMNEELRSAAEELETSKEELQSVNEELSTVNQELQIKIEELGLTNNDFQNLINSTHVGTIFLDRKLRVKLTTPQVNDVFNLRPSDIGRPLSDITSTLIDSTIHDDVQRVLDRLQTIDREVETRQGRWYLTRIVPYRTTDDRIDGVVITFQDITDRRQADHRIRVSEDRLRLLIDSAIDYAIFTMTQGGVVDSWNAGAERMYGFAADEIIGSRFDILFTPEDRAAGVPAVELETARRDGRASDERWHLRKDGHRFVCSGVTTRLGEGAPLGFAKIARDLTQQRHSHDELEAHVNARTRELQAEVIERSAAEEASMRILRKLVTAQEDERTRIARDLHDELGQQLTGLRLSLERHRDACGATGAAGDALDRALSLARAIDEQVDFLAWELRPATLDDLGLVASLPRYVAEWSKHHGVDAEFRSSGYAKGQLPASAEVAFYRIVQEALNNAAKHAHASRADVLLETRDGVVTLVIEDDGVGFELGAIDAGSMGMGLIGMRERAALIGASLDIESGPGKGTTIFLRHPIEQTAAEPSTP